MTENVLAFALSCGMAAEATAQQSTVMGTWQTASGSTQIRIECCADPAHGPICGSVVVLGQPTSADGKLLVRGHIGVPMFGESQLWTRIR